MRGNAGANQHHDGFIFSSTRMAAASRSRKLQLHRLSSWPGEGRKETRITCLGSIASLISNVSQRVLQSAGLFRQLRSFENENDSPVLVFRYHRILSEQRSVIEESSFELLTCELPICNLHLLVDRCGNGRGDLEFPPHQNHHEKKQFFKHFRSGAHLNDRTI